MPLRKDWLQRVAGRWSRTLMLSVLIGVMAGLAAAVMEWGLDAGTEFLIGRFWTPQGDGLWRLNWGVLLLPAAGGLLSGLAVMQLCPQATGHGTDTLTRAFHRGYGEMPLRAPTIKAALAVMVISAGGSAGPEGPIAALGAALGSTLGRWFHVTARERRILLIAGCAAGIGAIFRCPLGGALFAVGIVYSEPEYESEAMVPSVVASVIGYSVFISLWGTGEPLLHAAGDLKFRSPLELLPYALLGVLCGLVSILFSLCFGIVERHVAHSRHIPRWLAPALGGIATGAVACLVPAVLDGKYSFIQAAMDGSLLTRGEHTTWPYWTAVFAVLILAKCLATSLTVGSGASGGVLGPSVFLGGAIGAFLGAAFESLFPGAFPDALRQALIAVGMGGVLAASMRSPIGAIVMVMEMTGSYHLIVPSMLVCATAYIVGRRWGLNKEQVPTSAQSPVHAADAIIHMLESWRVKDFAQSQWPHVVAPATPLREIIAKIEPGTQPIFAVVEGKQLRGLIALPDLHRFNDPLLDRSVIAADIMTERLTTLEPDNDLYEALELFRLENFQVLPVVADSASNEWLGMLTRTQVFEAVSTQIECNRRYILEEYAALLAIDQQIELDNLLKAVAPRKDMRVERLMVPLNVLGKSLRESNFGNQFGAQIIALELPDGTLQTPPDLDQRLDSTYRLLAIVHQQPKPDPTRPVK